MSDNASATGSPSAVNAKGVATPEDVEIGVTSESGGKNSPTVTDAPTSGAEAPTHITVNLDDQPIIEIVKDGKATEFPADTFMIAVHEAGILKKEMKDEWSKNLTKVIEEVTGNKVGPLKAAEIYAAVLRLVRTYQKKVGAKLESDTTSPDSEPPKSEE